ncbi:hypothetical protein PVK06_001698 [Gossypium arboreum]|uniref:Uncharacterized protein n=1 Tax=Gossypium arboreum TaxID=29729 RepID=A0ABR0R2U6_GOSAR|nr:hypothetical protein PVK06_001698 [Gossypium arboreum]
MFSFKIAKLLKERLKKWHDKHIRVREFETGQQILLLNSRLRFFSSKLKSRWSGAFTIHRVYPYRVVELQAYFPFTISILCLKAKILTNVKKIGYSQGTITDWDLHRIARESILQQRAQESEDPEEKEEDPTMQSAEVPDKAEPVEPEVEPDAETSMFRAQSPHPDLRDELSKLMDIIQHMQWQQQAYWRYSNIRDDSIRSALKKIYNDPFNFVPKFPDFNLNHGVHYRRRRKVIHAKAIMMEQKMSRI